MPNIWTHLIFGQECLKAVNQSDLIHSNHDLKLFNLGCQGPDFLFYHQFLPWQKQKIMTELGSAMHKRQCGPALRYMIEQAIRADAVSPLLVYVCGFVLHHVLDRHMHPYVFYKSGFKPWDHQRFEIILDTLTARQLRQVETWKTPAWKEIYIGEALPEPIIMMMEGVAKQCYADTHASIDRELWNDAYRDMIRAQKLFHDPSGIRRILTLNKLEPFVFKRENRDLDYMNLQKKPWNHPCIEQEVYTDSFWDLWDRAMEDGKLLISDIITAFHNNPRLDTLPSSLIDRIGNVSYETGKPCDFSEPMNYVNSII